MVTKLELENIEDTKIEVIKIEDVRIEGAKIKGLLHTDRSEYQSSKELSKNYSTSLRVPRVPRSWEETLERMRFGA